MTMRGKPCISLVLPHDGRGQCFHATSLWHRPFSFNVALVALVLGHLPAMDHPANACCVSHRRREQELQHALNSIETSNGKDEADTTAPIA